MNVPIAIILPVFNDWASFSALIGSLSAAAGEGGYRVRVVVVDDGSTESPPVDLYSLGELNFIDSIELVRLSLNLGHQRALATGLCAALDDQATQQFVIMDADGEDRPQDIQRLMKSAALHPSAVSVAKRRKRNEKFLFRVFYRAYKIVFQLLTGKKISFGNFCLLSRDQAERLSMVPDLWNNLPAAVMRSRLPIERVSIDRGRRYFGSSKMNFVSLSLHGMSAYSVYTDAILVRLLIITFCIGGLGALLIAVVAILRLFTTLAAPGWGTTVFFGTAIIVSQAAFTTLMTALLLLNNRSQKLIVPAIECTHYIRSRTLLPFQREGPTVAHDAIGILSSPEHSAGGNSK